MAVPATIINIIDQGTAHFFCSDLLRNSYAAQGLSYCRSA